MVRRVVGLLFIRFEEVVFVVLQSVSNRSNWILVRWSVLALLLGSEDARRLGGGLRHCRQGGIDSDGVGGTTSTVVPLMTIQMAASSQLFNYLPG